MAITSRCAGSSPAALRRTPPELQPIGHTSDLRLMESTFPPVFSNRPTNVTAVEGTSATLSVLVTNGAAVSYQWQVNGTPLSSTTGPIYTVSNVSVSANNGQVYKCTVSNPAGTITSTGMGLTVIADKTPPTVTRVLNIGTNSVVLVYSKPVELASATSIGNYVFTNGLPITAAALASDNATVTLTTGNMVYGSNYTVVIHGVRDRASTPNTIAANTRVSFAALAYSSQDIGNPPIPTSIGVVNNGLNITASGSDIGGYADQFGLSYQLRTGDFDVAVRVAGLSASDVWAKAGLMARETLDAGGKVCGRVRHPGHERDEL